MHLTAAPGLVAAGAQVQVDPAALELELVDLALAVLFAPASKARTSRSRGRCWSSTSSSRTVMHRSYVKRSGSTSVGNGEAGSGKPRH
jgi:uncharacterized membrane protein